MQGHLSTYDDMKRRDMEQYPTLVILVGASGSGKSYTENLLVKNHDFNKLVSTTTRPMRAGEIHGVDYFFVNRKQFAKIEMIESVEFAGNQYGVSASELKNGNRNSAIVVEPHGMEQILEYIHQNRIGVYPFVVYFQLSKERLFHNMALRGDCYYEIITRWEADDISERFDRTGIHPDLTIDEVFGFPAHHVVESIFKHRLSV